MPHTVVTTTTTTTTSTSDGGFCNIGYARSFQGLLKIGQVVILLIAFLCVHCEHRRIEYSAFHYFEVVTAWFLIVFSIFFLMHLFRLQSKITCINWTLTEFLHYAVGGILVFIASIVVAVKSYGVSALIAGSVFGFIATFLIAISIWTSYKVTCGSQPTGAAV
ncbi:CKLF-like MARVEL transmembrane domain-containing protein 7 [Sinocyclocheilus anshuiensis]|uniref:CKLF-like MARVEL transmembrane domain-containing protein 7 n=1 Tax=Sinocyclocheilus anshuiensis TaxID=1608454 RepID=A0A671Q3S3_9TELE|nr:PREDICTED: CKLF-like MARVEL transmembrane domain-containing protein 7 [Sinocyclocheilus anshuiensis]